MEKYAKILENKYRANDFITQERMNRQRDVRINQMHRANGRLPPESLEDMDKDPDMGMASYNIDPRIGLPTEVDPLYVDKPLGKYEPIRSNNIRAQRGMDQDKIIKRKWKAEPQTQAEVRDCSMELTGE